MSETVSQAPIFLSNRLNGIAMDDPFGLQRFIKAQDACYRNVLDELTAGHKQSHWMWYIFPQPQGLGHSTTAIYYAITGIQEARA